VARWWGTRGNGAAFRRSEPSSGCGGRAPGGSLRPQARGYREAPIRDDEAGPNACAAPAHDRTSRRSLMTRRRPCGLAPGLLPRASLLAVDPMLNAEKFRQCHVAPLALPVASEFGWSRLVASEWTFGRTPCDGSVGSSSAAGAGGRPLGALLYLESRRCGLTSIRQAKARRARTRSVTHRALVQAVPAARG